MKKKWSFLMLFGVLNFTALFSQASFNVMFYNLLNFPNENAVPNSLAHLEVILADYQPDIFMVCEVNNENSNYFNQIIAGIDDNFSYAQLNTFNYFSDHMPLTFQTANQEKLLSIPEYTKTIPVESSYTYNVTLTNLSAGFYYIVAANASFEPLKFIKTH